LAKTTSPVRKAWRSLAILGGIIVALVGVNLAGVLIPGAGGQWTPKLALDLEGGTQIILAPVVAGGDSVSQEQLDQAVSIIRQRIDSAGVSESEITTQGASNIIVSLPGQPDQQTLERIEASAKLEFRPVLVAGVPSSDSLGSTATPAPTPTAADTPSPSPTDASDPTQITPELQAQYDAFDCATIDTTVPAPADQPLVTCEVDSSSKYILGPVEIDGADVSNATSGVVSTQTGASTGAWAVNIDFNDEGAELFGDVTSRLVPLPAPRNQFGIVLDGRVISAPVAQAVITDGNAQITGSNITQESAKTLADQLKYGALPISFAVQSSDVISATLGSSQLQSGLIAGLIGLILVVIYSLIQYRTLGLVTVASLIVAAVITYFLITFLSWREGYRLSLAGVAGLIVAIGITADSFIVYFERIRDELRDGRGLTGAVEAGWKRARRTVLASDTVNFLAAIVLFILAIGNVRGFALTLGLTTIIDLAVVALFTHPVLQLLSKTRFFSEGHRMSGLDPRALGAVYRGRAEFRPPAVTGAKAAASRGEAARRQTIAERRAAELTGAPPTPSSVPVETDTGTPTGTKGKSTTGAKGGKS